MFFHLDADRGTSPLNLIFVAVQSRELVRTPHRELHVRRRQSPPPHPACLAPGPLKGPLILRTEPRARVRATPPPHVLSILPHGRAEPGQALQSTPLSHQLPLSSGLSPTLARPELPMQGWASLCPLRVQGQLRGPRAQHADTSPVWAAAEVRAGQAPAPTRVLHSPLPVLPSILGALLFRD